MRKSNSVVATSMDGVQNNFTVHFRDKYEKLFKSTDDGTELLKVQKLTEARVFNQSLVDIMKVTPDVMKEAAQKLKPGKSDPIFSPLTVSRMLQMLCLPSWPTFCRGFLSIAMLPWYCFLLL